MNIFHMITVMKTEKIMSQCKNLGGLKKQD